MQNKTLTNIPKGFSLKLDSTRPRLTSKQAAAFINALCKDQSKYPLDFKTEICGPIDHQWMQVKFGDYQCGFSIRGGGVRNLFVLVTPKRSEYNSEVDKGVVSELVEDSSWDVLTKVLISRNTVASSKVETKQEIPQSTENEERVPDNCTKCFLTHGRTLPKGKCICTGDVSPGPYSSPGELFPLPEKTDRLIGIIPCFKVVIDHGTDHWNGVGSMYDHGPKLDGKETVNFPSELYGGNVFYSKEDAEKAANKFRKYFNAVKPKKSK